MQNTYSMTDETAPVPSVPAKPVHSIHVEDVLIWPNPVLKEHSIEVVEFNEELAAFCASLMLTMGVNRGYGISAVQIGNLRRIMVCMVDQKPELMINPVINEKSDEKETNWEGCLSVPGYHVLIARPKNVVVTYRNMKNEEVVLNTKTLNRDSNHLTPACIQHEIDHMDGVMFTDGLSELKRNMARTKVKKYLRNKRHAENQ